MHIDLTELHLPHAKARVPRASHSASKLPPVPEFASDLKPVEQVAPFVKDAAPSLPEGIPGDSFDPAVPPPAPSPLPSLDSAADPWMVETLPPSAPSVIATSAETLGLAATRLQDTLGQWGKTSFDCIQNTASNAGRLLGNLGQSLSQRFGTQAEALTQKTSEGLLPIEEAASQKLAQAGQASVNQLSGMVNTGQAWVSHTFPTPREFAESFGNRINDIATYASGWLQQRFQALIECIPESVYYPQKWPPKNSYKLPEE